MQSSPLCLLGTVACLALLGGGTASSASSSSEAILSRAWEEDEACSGEEDGCALSLRQLRGEALKARDHLDGRGQQQGGQEDPPDTILGVPLYTQQGQALEDNLQAGELPMPMDGGPREQRWIVSMVDDGKDLLDDSDDMQAGSSPWVILQGSREDLQQELPARFQMERVHFVEEDSVLRAVPELDVGEAREDKDRLGAGPSEDEENPPASWGLDRIDAKLGLDHWYEAAGYGGKGVHVYMLDTGILTTHEDFRGRAVPTLEVDNTGLHLCSETNTSCALDTMGHGTHTAGTVGGHRYGVAKAATLHAVKTLSNSGSGMISWMVQAMDWVTTQGEGPKIISASLGGKYNSRSLTKAIDSSVASGVTVVVAAGNENDDACKYMPARVASTITVGATAVGDARAPYSNYGACLDIFAPGSSIASAGVRSDTAMQMLSGTSMACPHVAGAVALLLGQDHGRSPEDVRKILLSEASKGKVFDPHGSPNLLLYTEPPLPRPTPLSNPARFEVYDGPCAVDDRGCVSNEGFPDSPYGNSEHCDVLVLGDVGHVHVESFDTERSFDALIVNFQRFSGTMERGNIGLLECAKPVGGIAWTSDRTDTNKGWKLCPEQQSQLPQGVSAGFSVVCGACKSDAAGCVSSPSYPGNYSGHASCLIDVVGDVPAIEVETFETEAIFDALSVNGLNYSGSEGPSGVKPTGRLAWNSDSDHGARGWKLCPGT